MIFGFLFALSIILFKLFVSHQKDMMIKSHFIAGMAMSMGIYILSGIILAFFVPDIAKKLIILLFALSPFIIGKLATYKLEKIYSFIQVFCVLISVVFVFFKT
jgi:hypothetical protein